VSALVLLFSVPTVSANNGLADIQIVADDTGWRLQVDDEDFMVFGMNWGYMPIGENYNYDFWGQPDDFIKAVLEREMPLLQDLGVNTIRMYVGMPPRWVQYVYETYGIWTIINHPVARWGITIDGTWYPVTDYSNPRVRDMVKDEIRDLVEEFQGTPGLLMWLLGNENNYGLSWSSFEIEALPEGEQNAARARYLYSLFGEIIDQIKDQDADRPVMIANGDLQYIDIIAEECENLDVLGSNVYRGISARDFYEVVRDKLGIPTMFTEFGADAYNTITNSEDQAAQAYYLMGQWEEIYEQSAGKGRVGNAIGGLIFQWSDGWWKFRQEERLEIHDTNASWPNAAYPHDYREGDNNMNEEWWGITAKGYPDARGFYDVYPRAAYYALRDAFKLDPYAPETDVATIQAHFEKIQPMAKMLEARGDTSALESRNASKIRLSGVRMEFSTYSTGGKNITTPPIEEPQPEYPSYLGFDHGQSFYADIEAKPNESVVGRLSVNVLGRVPENPINEIFYENRGRSRTLVDQDGDVFEAESLERVKVYQAELTWDDRWFMLDYFYRTGHLHWQYEGDFFGLYRDAYYGPNIDIYNGMAPNGVQISGKKSLEGLTVAFGPELWWGANPAVFAKYQRNLFDMDWTAVVQEDFQQRSETTSSIAIPIRQTRKVSLQVQTGLGPFEAELGALWSGSLEKGNSFQLMVDGFEDRGDVAAPEDVRQDTVKDGDTWGFKGKLTLQKGRWNWYGQGAYMGLVAEAGPTSIPTYTGWNLKDSGSGNQVNAITGVAVSMGNFQVGPNVLWQKPLVGPMMHAEDLTATGGRSRNIIDDPFAVRWNRETTGAELMLTYDPHPATWMWAWDNDIREKANFSTSLGLVFKRHHTTADAGLFISAEGNLYAFPGGTPVRDLWEINWRAINRFGVSTRMVTNAYVGTDEPNGDNTRLIERFGVESRIIWPNVAFGWHFKINDFGPYDYHRDFGLTYPLQLMGDLAFTLGTPRWFSLPETKFGVMGTYRTIDRYSPRYLPPGDLPVPIDGELYPDGLDGGREWEIRTYVHLAI
jgi:hypothetical protein